MVMSPTFSFDISFSLRLKNFYTEYNQQHIDEHRSIIIFCVFDATEEESNSFVVDQMIWVGLPLQQYIMRVDFQPCLLHLP